MASNITELFGYSPQDQSPEAIKARQSLECPFLKSTCIKKLGGGVVSGVCTIKQMTTDPVICCPVRLYANNYRSLRNISEQVFGKGLDLIVAAELSNYRTTNPGKACVAVFGKRWGKELRLPSRSKRKGGAYFVDWILAHVDSDGKLLSFVAAEVQSIDTTGNYRAQREIYMKGEMPLKPTTAGLNWENVNKRILPQVIYKGHVLRREPLCQKGLFFVCPTAVYDKIAERLGGTLAEIHQQAGAITIMAYDLGAQVPAGQIRALELRKQTTTTIDQIALAFTSPSNLPPARVYEEAIVSEL